VALPVHLQVEVTGACNLRCQMCLVAYREPVSRLSGSLRLEAFGGLLDAVPHLRSLTLQGLGEPLLAPALAEMIALAKVRGIETGFNTNGTLLDERHRRTILDLGVDWVHVSVDAADASVFESIRHGASYGRVVGNLRSLIRERRERRVPRVQLNAVLMRRTLAELSPLVRLAADLGVDRLWVQNLSHDLADTAGRAEFDAIRAFTAEESLWVAPSGAEDRDDVGTALLAAAELAARLGLDIRLPAAADREPATRTDIDELPCDWPWRSSYINHDGRVQPCCMLMGDARATMGNIHDAGGFAAVWNGAAYGEFRRRLLSPHPPDVCQGCAQYRGRF
jgi:radical SAM protein with 4Fe4S-binding SPASM domain